MNFMDKLKNNEKLTTENNAIGYKTSSSYLVDLNYKIPSYRNSIDKDLFDKALVEDNKLTLKWLLYLRDIREGVGERKSFREFVKYLCDNYEDLAYKFINSVNIAEYGRYDDYIWLYVNINSNKIKKEIKDIIRDQLTIDIINKHEGNSISLLAKWLPSINASSKVTRYYANIVRKDILNMSVKDYRKTLSSLRKYSNVVEVSMSNNDWESIDYTKVPSKANLIYSDAFIKHDSSRRIEYLDKLSKGEVKINAQALFLYDIVHKYNCKYEYSMEDVTLEEMWKAQDKCNGFKDTLVVRDGSGSMGATIPNSSVMAIDVADSLTLYCAENNSGQFKNKFITFSSTPKVLDVSLKPTLCAKLKYLHTQTDYTSTDIYKVFDLILETAIKNNMKQEDIPSNVLIISDMEFNYQMPYSDDSVLFESIYKKYEDNGYKLPKVIFWNVNSRTNAVPLTENDNGVILISGFSKNLVQMVMSSETDPYKALVAVLESDRYSCVDKIFE